MAKRDYYEILGVDKNASEEDIKKAYKKLAKEYHPDVAKNKVEAEKFFKEVNEAYQILRDSKKRVQYDQFGHAGVGQGGAGSSGFDPFGGFKRGQQGPFSYTYTWGGGEENPFAGGVDPFDIFEEVFGFRGFGRQPRKGRNLYYSLRITFVEAIKGITKKIKIGKEELDVKIPAGVDTGTELRLSGKGEGAPDKNLPRGDLFLTLEVENVRGFSREGSNVYTVENILLTQAILGAKIKISVVEPSSESGFKEVEIKIPAGIESGVTLRLSGKGFPRLRGSGRGDHFVKILIDTPTKLSKRQRELFEQLREEGL